ncbi:hypothetical protein FJV76_13685 [Mesorhizobium sp. WSM4303]|uniref:hypothetical protein n=1 Tax=unclassified Mesorhizobium TaxID=325217 RepID=UPI00115F378C|nr:MULTISPECIES: hypothetical protein [unclassified Mesorhizobium]TRC98350.1 hypothetical protein FJV77_07795 [Mesorhizobium sp. WSM4306]TRD04327.1 hypothetical protein FJV76_13685 [Mesorhizobium sp. WSM4303]
MARYQVEELRGDQVVSTNEIDAEDALSAVEEVTGRVVSPRELQEHWFRVVDEAQGTVHEFSIEESAPEEFVK